MTKFGGHIVQGSRNGYGEFADAKPAVCLFVDQDPAETEQKSGGHTVTIFRADSVYGEAPPGYSDHPDPAALARQWYPALKAKWLLNKADYYQVTNEQGGGEGPDVESNLLHLVAFEREMMRLANLDGFKVCVLNLAGGSPGDVEIWKRVCLPFIVEAWAGRNIYGRHVYGGGDLVNPDGSVIIGNPSRPFEEVGHLRAAGAAGGIAITECGLDAGFGFPGVDRFVTQHTGYEKLLRPYPEFIGECGWTLGHWVGPGGEETNWQDALPAMTQYLIDNPTAKWEWPGTPPPIDPPPSTYLHARLTAVANIRRDATTSKPAVVLAKEGLELVKVGDVTGQSVGGNNQWVKAVAFISRSYVTDSGPGKVKTNRSVNLRVVPTVAGNWPIVLLATGVEFEYLGNVPDFYNSGLWAAVAIYVWKPLTIDVQPGIRLGKLLPGTLWVTSPFNAPRSYPFAPGKKQLHEGLDFGVPIGTPVLAGAAGVVDFVRTVDPGYGYGKAVRIKHSDRYTTWLGHLSRVDVTVGQQVTAGQQVALSGNSGGSSGPHLHLTLVDNPTGLDGYVIDNVADPTLYLHPAVSLEPGQEPPPGDGVDLRLFKVAHPDAWRVVRGVDADGNQYSEDVQDMELSGGLYVRRKNNNAEWHKRDATFFYLVHDTSPAPGTEGIQRVYSLYKNGQPGAPKSKVVQAVGEVWQEAGTHLVQFRARDDCRPLSENSGNAQNSSVITAYEKNYRFNTYGQNLVFDEVIFEKTGVETQIYARHQGKAVGWIGWSAPWGSAEPVELYWDRGRMTQEPERRCSW